MRDRLSVRDHGATGSGETCETEAIQSAIDACADGGGGTVRVPAGEYLVGSLRLRSDVTLHLDAGATLVASTDESRYGPRDEHLAGLLSAVGAENVALEGDGVIDGKSPEFLDTDRVMDTLGSDGLTSEENYDQRQSDPRVPLYAEGDLDEGPVAKGEFQPAPLFLALRCEGVRIEGVTIRDSPAWTVHVLGCDGATVRDVDILNDERVPHSDGINPENSRNVTITGCRIVTGDHAISPKTSDRGDTGGPCENLLVTDCVLSSRSGAINIGPESKYDFRDHVYSNIVVRDSNRGLGVQNREAGDVENIVFSNVTVETVMRRGAWWGQAEPIHVSSLALEADQEVGTVRDLRFSDVVARSQGGISIVDEADSIDTVALDGVNLRIERSRVADSRGGNVDLRPSDVRPVLVGRDVPGVYATGVTDLSLDRVTVEWGDDVPSYHSHAIECESVEGLSIDGFVGRQARDGPAIALGSCTGVVVADSRAAPGTDTFLLHSECADPTVAGNNVADARTGVVAHPEPDDPGAM